MTWDWNAFPGKTGISNVTKPAHVVATLFRLAHNIGADKKQMCSNNCCDFRSHG